MKGNLNNARFFTSLRINDVVHGTRDRGERGRTLCGIVFRTNTGDEHLRWLEDAKRTEDLVGCLECIAEAS